MIRRMFGAGRRRTNRMESLSSITSKAGLGEARSEVLQLVTFRLSLEEFGVSIHALQEIIRMMPITRVPKAPPFVEGVVNLRGQVIPIIDLRKRIGMPP